MFPVFRPARSIRLIPALVALLLTACATAPRPAGESQPRPAPAPAPSTQPAAPAGGAPAPQALARPLQAASWADLPGWGADRHDEAFATAVGIAHPPRRQACLEEGPGGSGAGSLAQPSGRLADRLPHRLPGQRAAGSHEGRPGLVVAVGAPAGQLGPARGLQRTGQGLGRRSPAGRRGGRSRRCRSRRGGRAMLDGRTRRRATGGEQQRGKQGNQAQGAGRTRSGKHGWGTLAACNR